MPEVSHTHESRLDLLEWLDQKGPLLATRNSQQKHYSIWNPCVVGKGSSREGTIQALSDWILHRSASPILLLDLVPTEITFSATVLRAKSPSETQLSATDHEPEVASIHFFHRPNFLETITAPVLFLKWEALREDFFQALARVNKESRVAALSRLFQWNERVVTQVRSDGRIDQLEQIQALARAVQRVLNDDEEGSLTLGRGGVAEQLLILGADLSNELIASAAKLLIRKKQTQSLVQLVKSGRLPMCQLPEGTRKAICKAIVDQLDPSKSSIRFSRWIDQDPELFLPMVEELLKSDTRTSRRRAVAALLRPRSWFGTSLDETDLAAKPSFLFAWRSLLLDKVKARNSRSIDWNWFLTNLPYLMDTSHNDCLSEDEAIQLLKIIASAFNDPRLDESLGDCGQNLKNAGDRLSLRLFHALDDKSQTHLKKSAACAILLSPNAGNRQLGRRWLQENHFWDTWKARDLLYAELDYGTPQSVSTAAADYVELGKNPWLNGEIHQRLSQAGHEAEALIGAL